MKLRILSVAYPFAEAGPDSVGGAEQVLSALDAALVANGHESCVIAAEGSQVSGRLIGLPQARGVISDEWREQTYKVLRVTIARLLASDAFDLVHMHGIDFYRYIPAGHLPVIATLHLPLNWYPPEIFSLNRANLLLNAVSESQARTAPDDAGSLPVITNGIDSAGFRLPRKKGGYALCLGRICPEKGYHLGLEAARKAAVPLVIAGKVYPYAAHENYFKCEIVPRLGAKSQFIGPVGFDRKRALFSAARCLLIPSTAPETSSLVAMEAIACGTPVIAFRIGALPEIVRHGETGFLVNSVDEMAEAIRYVDQIDPEACIQYARSHFGLVRTVERYFASYRKLIAHSSIPQTESEVLCAH